MLQSNLRLWGVDGAIERTGHEIRVVLDRLPSVSQRMDGWTAQAGTLSADTVEIASGDEGQGDVLDLAALGRYRIADIEHDGHGWAVMELAYTPELVPFDYSEHRSYTDGSLITRGSPLTGIK